MFQGQTGRVGPKVLERVVQLAWSGRSALECHLGTRQCGGMTSDDLYETPELMRTIEPSHCLQLLEAVPYGRLATVDQGRPLLVVVNHLLDDGDIYIRTRPDARLARLTENGRVAPALYE